MVTGRAAGSSKLRNSPRTAGASCVCHAPSQLPRALQPGGDVCPAPRFTLTFPFLLGRGRRLNERARDIDSRKPPDSPPPRLGLIDQKLLSVYRTWTDEELLAQMTKVLMEYAGEEGVKAAAWFATANGAPYRHGPDSALSKMAQETRQFVSSCHTLLLRVREAVSRLAAGGREPNFAGLGVAVPETRWGLLDVPTAGVPKVAGNEAAMKALFGGTQGEEIWVTALKHDRPRRAYLLRLRWHIFDHFGVDESDLYHKSLYAFWVLQHERPGYAAYVNELVIERWMAGTY